MRRFRRLLATLFAVALVTSSASAQNRGTVTGQVVDASTRQPLQNVQVGVTGTTLGALTNAEGRFNIQNVPAGAHEVRANRLGYQASSQRVSVASGGTTTANFQLSTSVVALDEIVVTGTAGAAARREQPAVVASIDVSDVVQKGVVSSVKDVLTARVPGVSVTSSSGTSGTSQQIRIRGAASVSLSNEPLVFIDGVRADSRTRMPFEGSSGFGIGGQGVSRLFDIDPEDIESIEVVKGPAAATLYGADASAGVIQIITKKGRTGVARFTQSISTEYNLIDPNFTPPANFAKCSAAHIKAGSGITLCEGQPVGTVVQDNPLVRERAFQDGELRSLGYNARGGGENYGYFLSLGLDKEQGTLPNNELGRRTARMNFTFVPTPKVSVEAGFGIYRTFNKLPDNDNNIYGFMGGGLLGFPTTVGTSRNGFYAPNRNVEAISSIRNELVTLRYTPTLQMSYTPVKWFSNRLTVGADVSRGQGLRFFPRNEIGMFAGTTNKGFVGESRNNFDAYTVDYLGNIRNRLLDDRISSDFSFGVQLVDETTDQIEGTGLGLTTNAARVISAASEISARQSFVQTRSIGVLAQEQIGLNDRLFLQVGGRVDMNSSFGEAAEPFFLPKVGASYVVSEEPFFEPLTAFIPTLRLRAAYGTTGRSPTSGASLQTFDPAPFALETGSGSGVIALNPGNRGLRPERGREFEAGFEAGFLSDRMALEVTYFNKQTTDLLVRRPLAPSAGFNQNPFVNLGESLNSGVEYSLRASLVNRRNFQWDARVAGSTLRNELVSLGEIDGVAIQPFGTLNRFTPGKQLGAFHTRTIKSVDLERKRVTVSDTIEYAGNYFPTVEGNAGTTVTLFNNLQVSGQLDWKRDFSIYNGTAQFRERAFRNARNAVDPDALSEEEKLRRFGPFFDSNGRSVSFAAVQDEYIERGDFVRLREVAATLSLPKAFAQRVGATGASLTVGGQNLGLWTEYTGPDPEVVYAVAWSQFDRTDFLTVPSPRRWVAKVNFQF